MLACMDVMEAGGTCQTSLILTRGLEAKDRVRFRGSRSDYRNGDERPTRTYGSICFGVSKLENDSTTARGPR